MALTLPTLQSMDTLEKQKNHLNYLLDKQHEGLSKRIRFVPMQSIHTDKGLEIKATYRALDYNETIQYCVESLKDKVINSFVESNENLDTAIVAIAYVGPLLFNVKNEAILTSPIQYVLSGVFSTVVVAQEEKEVPVEASESDASLLVVCRCDIKLTEEFESLQNVVIVRLEKHSTRDTVHKVRGVAWKSVHLLGINVECLATMYPEIYDAILLGCATNNITPKDFVVADVPKEKDLKEEKEITNESVGARILETVKHKIRTENLKEDLEKFEFVAKNNITKSELERIIEMRKSLWGTPIMPNKVDDDKESDGSLEKSASNKYPGNDHKWANSSMRLIEETVIQGLVDLDNKRAEYIEGAKAFGINLI